VQERAVERLLRDLFPGDEVLPVPKGVHGGDVIQRVIERDRDCGAVLWESKRTRRWYDGWTAKARDDQRAAGAAHAVIVTETMPEGCDTFTHADGVWITTRRCAPGVAAAVRAALVAVAGAQRAVAGKQEKADALYRYLIGPEFRNRVSGIAEAFVEMLGDLEAERRSTQRLWAKREKQLRRAAINTSAFYGDIQGVLGSEVAAIEKLELPALPEQEEQAMDGPAQTGA
jgi:hypothetical protein